MNCIIDGIYINEPGINKPIFYIIGTCIGDDAYECENDDEEYYVN